MKSKYEDYNIIIFFFIIIFLLELFLFVSLFNIKLSTYKVFSGVVYKDKCIQVVVDDKELNILNSNKSLSYKNKKKYYEIIDIDREIINNYNLVTLRFNFKRRVNDVVTFSVLDKKIKFIEMFKIIWKE